MIFLHMRCTVVDVGDTHGDFATTRRSRNNAITCVSIFGPQGEGTQLVKRITGIAVLGGVAIAAFAGGHLVSGASPNTQAAFVSIVPCRLIDTRPDSDVGSASQPLGHERDLPGDRVGSQRELQHPDHGHRRLDERHRGQRHGRQLPHDLAERRRFAAGRVQPQLGSRFASHAEQGRRQALGQRQGLVLQPQRIGRHHRRRRRLLRAGRSGGPQGPAGPQGPVSPVGTLEVVTANIPIDLSNSGVARVRTARHRPVPTRHAGDLGRRRELRTGSRSTSGRVVPIRSADNPTGWFGDVRSGTDRRLRPPTVYAVCVNP